MIILFKHSPVSSHRRVTSFVFLFFRLVVDDEGVTLYYSVENSRVYHEQESQYMEFTVEV